jgi:mRNA interferase ChpB
MKWRESMDRGDIYLLSRVGGAETQRIDQSIMVVTPARFNKVTQMPVVLPIVKPDQAIRTAGFAVSLAGSGATSVGVVRCDQPRVIDMSQYVSHRVEKAPLAVVDEIMAKLNAIMVT